MKVKILTDNICLSGKIYKENEIADIKKEEFDIVKRMDKHAKREFRLKQISKFDIINKI